MPKTKPLRRKLPPSPSTEGMNLRQRLFADEYLASGNATASYKAAGYKTKTEDVAAHGGSDLLRNPHVAAYIAKRQAARLNKYAITQDRALEVAAHGAYFDPLEFFDQNGKVKPLAQMSEAARRAITEIELDAKGRPVKLKAAGRRGYLDMIFRFLQMYKDAVGGILIPTPGPGTTTEVSVKMTPEEGYRRMLKRAAP